MITDQQEQNMHKDQAFQWAAIKAIIIEDGKILLGKRLDEDDYEKYETPGGKIEVGENLKEALIREVQEESGVEVEPINLLETEGQPIYMSQVTKKGQLRVVLTWFLAKVKSKEHMLEKTEEMEDIRFYSKDEVQVFLTENKNRPSERNLMQMFVEGKLEKK